MVRAREGSAIPPSVRAPRAERGHDHRDHLLHDRLLGRDLVEVGREARRAALRRVERGSDVLHAVLDLGSHFRFEAIQIPKFGNLI